MKFIKFVFFIVIFLAFVYSLFWFTSRKKYPVTYGISFNQNHAQSLGLDWREVYVGMIDELEPDYVRIAAMWNQVESVKSVYDFSDVDFMMDKAAKAGTKVTLVVGQKAPRWPECHVPEWLDYGIEESSNHLLDYVTEVVERYKDHPALEIWQVENEPYIRFVFGECENYNQDVVKEEIALVKRLDPNHLSMVTDSGELSTWRRASKATDLFGTTLYRIVQTPGGRNFNYDWLPASFYRYKAKLWGRDLSTFFVAELQMEPWFTDSNPLDATIEEQEKTMNPERMGKHFDYVERIGVPRAYLWGVEWWYFMKEVNGDERYWEIVGERLKIEE